MTHSLLTQSSSFSLLPSFLEPAPPSQTRPLIAVVDDSEFIAATLEMALNQADYATCLFSSGKALLKWLNALPQAPSPNCENIEEGWPALILLDYVLPELDGLEVCQWLRTNLAQRCIPIIVMTGLDTPHLCPANLAKAGVNWLLQKPFTLEELLATLEKVGISR